MIPCRPFKPVVRLVKALSPPDHPASLQPVLRCSLVHGRSMRSRCQHTRRPVFKFAVLCCEAPSLWLPLDVGRHS